jgi:hypothetical protein
MGRAIIGGVITSTLLTLIVVPVLYSYLVREKKPEVVAEEAGVPPDLTPSGALIEPVATAAMPLGLGAGSLGASPAQREHGG